MDEQASAAAEAAVEGRWAAGQPSSPYEGVCWVKQRRLWKAYIYNKGGQVLGHFVEEKDAARAYDDAARRLRDDKAHGGTCGWRGRPRMLNFPTEAEVARFEAR